MKITYLKIIISAFLSSILFGCSLFCEERGETLMLKDFENTLLPFTNEQEVTFVNNNKQIYITTIQDIFRQENDFGDDRPCNNRFQESIGYTMEIDALDYAFFVQVLANTNNSDQTIIRWTSLTDKFREEYIDILDQFTTYQDDNITIDNVLVVDSFNAEIPNETPVTDVILYSRERGVEYILFTNGDYLILQP